jgi:hypothetical protein
MSRDVLPQPLPLLSQPLEVSALSNPDVLRLSFVATTAA